MVKIAGLIIMITIIWGYTWVTMKIGLQYVPPFLFASLRLLIGALLLFAIQWTMRKRWIPAKKDWNKIVVLGLLMSFGFFGLLTYGMQFVSAGQTSVLVYSMPIIVSVLAHFFLQEKLTVMKVAGLIMGAAGLLFIIGPQVLHVALDKVLLGQILIVLSAVCWACANVYSKIRFINYDTLTMISWQMLIGGILLFAVSAVTEPMAQAQWTVASSLSLLFNGIFASAVAFVAWFWVLNKIEASIASITLMAVPVLGLFFGWLQLNETLTLNILVGAVFICLGIFFGSYKSKRKRIVLEKSVSMVE